jgi:hypothetical protein
MAESRDGFFDMSAFARSARPRYLFAQRWIMVDRGRRYSSFVDVMNTAGLIERLGKS